MKTAKPVKHVIVDDLFWKKYKQVVAEEVIPYQWKALNDELPDTEPSHAIENFRIAMGNPVGSIMEPFSRTVTLPNGWRQLPLA